MKVVSSRLSIVGLCLVLGCATSGPVETQLTDSLNKVVSDPVYYNSPHEVLEAGVTYFRKINGQKLSNDKVLFAKALLELYQQQNLIQRRLASDGEVLLKPGNSYDFYLQSFCVHAGKSRPFNGDGLNSGPLKGTPTKWLPTILKGYREENISQQNAQLLIWSLLSGLRFDELASEEKETLRKFFPDAAVRFGNRFIEDKAKGLISDYMPTPIIDGVDKLNSLRGLVSDAQNTYAQVEEAFAPAADHQAPIPVGWLKTPEGYLMHLESNGYQEVRVKLYVPRELKSEAHFRPSDIIAIPSKGQRLAISPIANEYQNNYLDPTMKSLLKLIAGRSIQDSELDLIKKYPIDAVRAFLDAQEAVRKTNDIFKDFDSLHNNEADAFRHFYWSSRLSSQLGIPQADKFLTAHEDDESQPKAEKEMDLFNNHVGEKFVRDFQESRGSTPTERDIAEKGIESLKKGELKVIDPSGHVPEIEE